MLPVTDFVAHKQITTDDILDESSTRQKWFRRVPWFEQSVDPQPIGDFRRLAILSDDMFMDADLSEESAEEPNP